MGDPSERHGELLECGCEFAQGTWFYCPKHQPRVPTDAMIDAAWRESRRHGGSCKTLPSGELVHCCACGASFRDDAVMDGDDHWHRHCHEMELRAALAAGPA